MKNTTNKTKTSKTKTRMKTCCLCGAKFNGYGNNPWPLAELPSRCCDACNGMKVLPARIKMEIEYVKKESKATS